MINSTMRSILAAECGSVTTTAILIERVNNRYRLTAAGQTPSTYGPPWQDITMGVGEAVRQIEQATGRTLLAPGGWPVTPQSSDRQGVDAFVAVSSAGPPLQLVLAGLMQDVSLTSARRAAATTYTAITGVLSLDADTHAGAPEAGGQAHHSIEARIQAIQRARPEAILLVGGTDGGAERAVIDMANALAMAVRVLKDTEKPHVLYAGNSAMRAQVAEILGPVAILQAVDNIRPTLDVENLIATQTELEKLYIQRKMARLPGFQKLSNWSRYPIAPTSKSFEHVIAYIGRQNKLNVIGVNIGSGSTLVSTQAQNHPHSTIRSDAGVGHSMASLLKAVPVDKIHRWLPFSMPPEELYNKLLNKSLSPAGLPTTFEDLMIEHAVAREGLRLVVAQARAGWPTHPSTGRGDLPWNLLIGAGRPLTRAPHPGSAALILLDGVEPWGVTSLALDSGGATGMLGSIAAVQPVAAVEVAAHDTFLNLGTVIAPMGHGSPGEPALKIKINYVDPQPRENNALELEIAYGSIEVIPLPPGQKAKLEIRPTRHFDIGLDQPGRGAVTEIEGGLLGVIIDARGRPLRLPPEEALRRELLEQWLLKLGVPYGTAGQND